MPEQSPRWLDPHEQRSWRALVIGMTLLTDRLDADLQAEFSLSLNEYEIMVRLSEQPDSEMRMAQLADAMCHSRSRITHTISRMERSGLVSRRTCDEDGRGVFATLTTEGYALLEKAAPTHARGVLDYLIDRLDPTEVASLGTVMGKVVDHLASAHPGADIR